MNTKDEGVVANISGETFQVIEKSTLYLTMNIQANKNYNAFTIQLLNTRIDVEKLINNLYGNFLIKTFMSKIMDHVKALNNVPNCCGQFCNFFYQVKLRQDWYFVSATVYHHQYFRWGHRLDAIATQYVCDSQSEVHRQSSRFEVKPVFDPSHRTGESHKSLSSINGESADVVIYW